MEPDSAPILPLVLGHGSLRAHMVEGQEYWHQTEDLQARVQRLRGYKAAAQIDGAAAEALGLPLDGPVRGAQAEEDRLANEIVRFERLLRLSELGKEVYDWELYDHYWNLGGYVCTWNVVSAQGLDDPHHIANPDTDIRIPMSILGAYEDAVKSGEFQELAVTAAFNRPDWHEQEGIGPFSMALFGRPFYESEFVVQLATWETEHWNGPARPVRS